MKSATRQGLQDIHAGTASNRRAQFLTIGDDLAIDEDSHMRTQATAVFEQVAAHRWIYLERVLEHLSHGISANINRRTGDVALEDLREGDARHGGSFACGVRDCFAERQESRLRDLAAAVGRVDTLRDALPAMAFRLAQRDVQTLIRPPRHASTQTVTDLGMCHRLSAGDARRIYWFR